MIVQHTMSRDDYMQLLRERNKFAAEIERLQSELQEARTLMRDIVDGWDWWRQDEYDRCQSVPGDAIDAARAVLAKTS